jgi:hypothetical protein
LQFLKGELNVVADLLSFVFIRAFRDFYRNSKWDAGG